MTAACCSLIFMVVGWQDPAAAPAGDEDPTVTYAGNACVECHANLPGRLGEIALLEWRNSVHYANKVSCDGCHGGDAGVEAGQFDTPEAFKNASHLQRDTKFLTADTAADQFISAVRGRNVSYFCGKCHALIKEKHLGSPHGDYGDPSCLYCHARTAEGRYTHRIEPATLDIIDIRGREENGRCAVCHKQSTMAAVGQIKQTLVAATDQINIAADRQAELVEHGYRSLELQGLTEHGQEVHSRLRRVFHSFDMREINDFTGEITALAERTERTHELLTSLSETRSSQTIVSLVVVVFLLSFAALLLYYEKVFCTSHTVDTR